MNIKRLISAATASLLVALTLPAAAFAATSNTVTVTGNNQSGWQFNRDSTTPYQFTEAKHSIGQGSLYAGPISTVPSDKFVAEQFLATPVNEVTSLAYDFQIAGNGSDSKASNFYLNVYANVDSSSTYYDCRYDYVPTTGSTASFTTASFATTSTPSAVLHSSTSRVATCPATLAEMPNGSYIRAFAVNIGQSTDVDQGLAGYIDKVVVTKANATSTIYDFEKNLPVSATKKDDCKDGKWKTNFQTTYKNQGDCVSSVASDGKAKGNPSVLQSISSKFHELLN